jgi:peptidoglycan hydrolase CwlO-like protein
MNRKAMIISMEATVKALDAQKLELEKVIFALKQEEAEEEGLVAENAGENAAGAGVDVTAGNATVNADDAADGDAADNVDVDAGGDTEELEVSDSSGSF